MKRILYIIPLLLAAILVIVHLSSMGRVKNPLLELMVTPSTTYIIDRVYNLRGESIKVPEKCTLVFSNRGKICNGEIVGNSTTIKCNKSTIGAKLSGTWHVEQIYDVWFDTSFLSDDEIIENINNLMSDDIKQRVFLAKKEYNCSLKTSGRVLQVASNTDIYLNTMIRLLPTDRKDYSIVSIRDKHDVSINGGYIEGDVLNHIMPESGSPGEWGMGVKITRSIDISIDSVYITHCWGDGIYVGGGAEKQIGEYQNASKNITIRNVTCDNNRRQGMSITHVDGMYVMNCTFINTGTSKYTGPGAGIDIEPNIEDAQNQSCRNLFFENCIFEGNKGSAICNYNSYEIAGRCSIENISLHNCVVKGNTVVCASSIYFRKCELGDLYCFINASSVNVVFEDCIIRSSNTQIKPREPKKGYKGDLNISVLRCRILLNDANEWKKYQKWNKIDSLTIEGSDIILPSRFVTNNLVSDATIRRILMNNSVYFD